MSIVESDYHHMSFNRDSGHNDSLKRYRSETHRDFFESKFRNTASKPGVEFVITDTLSKVSGKLRHKIMGGSEVISPTQSNINKVNKKLQLDLAASELNYSLDIVRAKGGGVLTKSDYAHRKLMLNEKLEQLKTHDLDSNLALELSKFEKTTTFGDGPKSLVGKYEFLSQLDDHNTVDLSKQLFDRMRDDKNEHRRIMKLRKQKIREKKMKLMAEKDKLEKDEREEMGRL